MRDAGLISTLRTAAADWVAYRRELRRFKRWLAGGRVTTAQDPAAAGVFAASFIRLWIVLGVDEVLIAPRRLSGSLEIENDPAFWTPTGHDFELASLRAIIDLTPSGEPDSPEWMLHHARYAGFARYDEFHKSGEAVTLARGYPHRAQDARLVARCV